MNVVVHRSQTRVSGSGFPPLVWATLGVLAPLALVAQLLTTTRMMVFGRTVEGRIVDLERYRGITHVTVEYPTDDGEVSSSRGGFNGKELRELAAALVPDREGPTVEVLMGAAVPVRYVPARPTMAHIARWVPLYRELVVGHLVWMALARAAVFCYRHRQRG
jgi:hypothetical protein